MKLGFYPQMAMTGISKNRKLYLPYILTCAGMIMMFYIIEFLSVSPSVTAMPCGDDMQIFLVLGCYIMGIFSLIFLFYTNSFLIKKRKREFGLYNILGMGKKNLARILVWESLIVAVISLAAGLVCGILFSKLAELCLARILQAGISFAFSISLKSVMQTLIIFSVIFVLILLNSLRQIHVSKPIELLHSDTVGEKPPRANWVAAVLGVIILGGAYYLALSVKDPLSALLWFFIAVILVIIATYMLFIAGSVVLCKLLKKNKHYYYSPNHFVSVSSMAYRMKRNGAGLASICILSTMVLVILSTTVCLFAGEEDSLRRRFPRDLVIDTYSTDAEYADTVEQTVCQFTDQSGIEQLNLLNYHYLDVTGYFSGANVTLDKDKLQPYQLADYSNIRQLFLVPLADYNRLMGASETLGGDEVLLYCTKQAYAADTITIEGCPTMNVKKHLSAFVDNGVDAMQIISSVFVIVPDESVMKTVFDTQASIFGDNASYMHTYYGFDMTCDDDAQIALQNSIAAAVKDMRKSNDSFPRVNLDSKAAEKFFANVLYGGLFFLGILLGIVFVAATVLIMYYKQITEGYEDQSRFSIMRKVGMTRKEIRKSINSQVLTVFFLPLIIAGVHIAFAFPMIFKLLALFNLDSIGLFVAVTVACYLVFALFYALVYVLTSRAYYSIVSTNAEA